MAVGAAGVGDLGGPLPEAAFPVRADQQLPPLVLHQKQQLTALRAGLPGLVVVGVGGVAGLHVGHQLRCVLPHLGHKVRVPLLALGDPGQPVLPLCGQRRAAQIRRGQLHQLDPLGGGHQGLALALDIEGREQLFNDVRPGGGGAQAGGLLQDLLQVLVRHLGNRMLHGGQQGGLGVPGRRRGLAGGEPELPDLEPLALLQVRQPLLLLLGLVVLVLQGGKVLVVGRLPALVQHPPARGGEGLISDLHGQTDLLIFKGGHQHRQEAADHQIIDIFLRAGEFIQGRRLLGGDDGVVVGDLGVVHQVLGLEGLFPLDSPGQLLILRLGHRPEPVRQGGHHVVGDVAAVGPGVGQSLVPLIEALHQVQGLLGGVGVFLVGVPLELRQVVGRRGRGHLPHFGDLGDDGLLALAGLQQPFQLFPVEGAAAALLVLPGGPEALQLGAQAVELPGHEAADLILPLHHQSQGRGLDPAGGELGVEFAGQGPGHVEPHQPVRLGPGLGGPVEIVVILGGLQIGEALPDGLVGLGGDPQPLGRLVPAGLLHDPAGHQLSLPAGVGGDDQVGDVPPLHQIRHHLVLAAALGDHH